MSSAPASTSTTEIKYVTEVPSSLKQLARLVVRGFYTIEDALIIDMLVRNPCMKEDDIAELLRFEKKQMRARITTLRSDKFIQIRLKMETGPDGKAQKVNYYFINYKTFVNVVKYKLDLMRKRMETEERDATSRASFKCTNCNKTFTDLEADQLFDFNTQEFRCTYCGSTVEEDSSAMPTKDSRLMLARFNEQLQPLYDLLREVEGIKLAPEILEPEPVDIDTIRGYVITFCILEWACMNHFSIVLINHLACVAKANNGLARRHVIKVSLSKRPEWILILVVMMCLIRWPSVRLAPFG